MTIDSEQLADGVTKISLVGRMDISGAEEIDLRFAALVSAATSSVIVDLSAVTFLASIGIRTFIGNAKALKLRGGLLVLLNPQPLVAEILHATGITEVIPVLESQAAAVEMLKAVGGVQA